MLEPLFAVYYLLFYDVLFLVLLLALLAGLSTWKKAAFAILKRNFVGYFSNPTGYVFLCLFVLLTSMAAFWPHEFFTSNLATLGQLNKWFTIIMLFFIPAITMSIWAEERRQGTDELLLTLPADDFDIVIGKFLAAASIYTTSLLFSQLSTFIVLVCLTKGDVDTGLFFANYLGYWCIGLSMIAIGMIASFLTNNLTVGFILGALFNAPLVFAAMADVIVPSKQYSRLVTGFSMSERFDDFGRGVISLSSIGFFGMLSAFGLYLCMVMIGKRHWSGGKEGNTMAIHFLGRVLCLLFIALFGSLFFRNNDYIRQDVTDGKVSSISPTTRSMIQRLKPDQAIVVDAFLSADVPEAYAKTKYDLISMLKEFESVARRSKVPMDVRIYDGLDSLSDQAKRAEDQYGIVPNPVRVRERGGMSDQNVLLGVAFRSGLEKVVVPFFGSGVPVEYELIRSLNTVSRPARKKLGVLKTDAQMNGGFNQGNFQPIQKQAIVNELSKQYEIVDIDPSSTILPTQCDVLLAVQPSSLGPEQMTNFTEAVKKGIPVAIFEDPKVVTMGGLPGTGEAKPQAGGMFGGAPPQPKGDIVPLWKSLGIKMPGMPNPMSGGMNPDFCWHAYNPYPALAHLQQANDLWVFIREEAAGEEPAFSPESPITKGLRELLFLYAGTIEKDLDSKADVQISRIVQTGDGAGRLEFSKFEDLMRKREDSSDSIKNLEGDAKGPQAIAVQILGAKKEAKEGEAESKPLNVVYVADVDCLSSIFVDIRNQPDQFEELNFRLQNVTFVLNVMDILAGEPEYAEVRRHEPQHSTLKLVEESAASFKSEEAKKRDEHRKAFEEAKTEAESKRDETLQEFKERLTKLQKGSGVIDSTKQREILEAIQKLQNQEEALNKKLKVQLNKLARDRDQKVMEARRESELKTKTIQDWLKTLAVFLPPIPPLIVGIVVFISRRLREREGISKTRLR